MALSGVHVSCVRAGGIPIVGLPGVVPVYAGAPVWSENLTAAGTGTHAAPASPGMGHNPSWVLIISAASEAYIAVGASPGTPSATNGYYVPAAGRIEIAVSAGDTWAWAAA